MERLKITNTEIQKKIALANQARKKLMDEGWEETPSGLLPPDEIKKAGFVKSGGEWLIPTDVYISEVARGGLKKGEKYLGVSMQYVRWRDSRDKPPESGDQKIDKEINDATKVAKDFGGVVVNGEINVEKIPF